jgi:diguanylate cyclase (GGDEF)-like protein
MDTLSYDPNWVIDALANGLVVLDSKQLVVTWNRWMVQHSGISKDQAMGKTLDDICPSVQNSRLYQAILEATQHRMSALISPALHQPTLKLYQAEKDRPHDRRMQQLIHVVPMPVKDQPGCLLQIHDMTATVKRERRLRLHAEQLKASSFLDPLTGVYNRKKFDENIKIEFQKAQENHTPLSLIMVNIDHIKSYKEHYGEVESDRCLAKIAQTLRDTLRNPSDATFRFGPDEFVMLLPGTGEKSAGMLAERLRLQVESLMIPHAFSKTGHYLTISLGVSTTEDPQDVDSETLIHAADVALYEAKSDGYNSAMCFSVDTGNLHACY